MVIGRLQATKKMAISLDVDFPEPSTYEAADDLVRFSGIKDQRRAQQKDLGLFAERGHRGAAQVSRRSGPGHRLPPQEQKKPRRSGVSVFSSERALEG